jgi:hypothetical protein
MALLIVAGNDICARLREIATSRAVEDWKQHIHFFEVERSLNLHKWQDGTPSKVQELSAMLDSDDGEYPEVLVAKDLGDWFSVVEGCGKSAKAEYLGGLSARVKREIEDKKLSWKSRAQTEWLEQTDGHNTVDGWLQQFNELGIGWVGTALLRQFTVISDTELKRSLETNKFDFFGLSVAHLSIKDKDRGGSPLKILHFLGQMYPGQSIGELDLDKLEDFPFSRYAVVYIYEDGLWSGVELGKRLGKLLAHDATKFGNCRIHFRYGAVCDVGLYSARELLRGEQGRRFIVERAGLEELNLRVLSYDDAAIQKLLLANRNAERPPVGGAQACLDHEVRPYAFSRPEYWDGRAGEGEQICRELGAQLVLQRDPSENDGLPITAEAAAKDSLGSMNYGMMHMFASSVPKTVLPLFYLPGNVTFREKTVNWKPLIWDRRRIGRDPP